MQPGCYLLQGNSLIQYNTEIGEKFIALLSTFNIPYKIVDGYITIIRPIFLATPDENTLTSFNSFNISHLLLILT